MSCRRVRRLIFYHTLPLFAAFRPHFQRSECLATYGYGVRRGILRAERLALQAACRNLAVQKSHVNYLL